MIIINRIKADITTNRPAKTIVTVKRDGLRGPSGPQGEKGEKGADGAAQIPEILDGGNF